MSVLPREAMGAEVDGNTLDLGFDNWDICLRDTLAVVLLYSLHTRCEECLLTDTSATPSNSLNMFSNTSKKSSLVTCFGTTQSVSISDPGPWTPRRYEPNVKIFPPAALAAVSERPRAIDTLCTNFFTRVATRPNTSSLYINSVNLHTYNEATKKHYCTNLFRDSSSLSNVPCRRSSSIIVAVTFFSPSFDSFNEIGCVTPHCCCLYIGL